MRSTDESMTIEKKRCVECGAEILATTAAKWGGKCGPCDDGTRARIEESKRWNAERRRLEKVNESARARILQEQRPIFGDFLGNEDPLGVLWPIVVNTVFSEPDRKENIEALAPEARVIYLVQILDGEVINGGFHQFFSNSSGNHTHETHRALLEIGAVDASRLLATAIAAFPQSRVHTDRVTRNSQLDIAHEKSPGFFDSLDTEYDSLTDADPMKEDLAELMLSYMRKHSDAPIASG